MTLDIEARVHICHILKDLRRRLYRCSLSAKNTLKILVKII